MDFINITLHLPILNHNLRNFDCYTIFISYAAFCVTVTETFHLTVSLTIAKQREVYYRNASKKWLQVPLLHQSEFELSCHAP